MNEKGSSDLAEPESMISGFVLRCFINSVTVYIEEAHQSSQCIPLPSFFRPSGHSNLGLYFLHAYNSLHNLRNIIFNSIQGPLVHLVFRIPMLGKRKNYE